MRPSRAVAAVAVAAVTTAGGLAASSLAAPSGSITTVVGTGQSAFGGDGGPPASAELKGAMDVAATADGGYLVADSLNDRVRKVSPTGRIATVAGDGSSNFNGDGGPATEARLHEPTGVSPTADGGFLIADTRNHRIRKVSSTGTITTVAGTGESSFSGDGGPATAATLKLPAAVAALPDGGFLIADTDNHRIRQVSAGGTISTFAGEGTASLSGDDGPSTAATFRRPSDVAVLPSGDVLVADTENARIRRVNATTGTITTVAGGGSGPAGTATALTLNRPRAVIPAGDGGFALTDAGDHRVGFVAADGRVTHLAGTGESGWSGDNGPGVLARVHTPVGLTLDAMGRLLFADSNNHRVRRLDVDLRPTPPPADPPPPTTPTTPADPPPTTPTDPPAPTTPTDPPPPTDPPAPTTPTDPPAPTTPTEPPAPDAPVSAEPTPPAENGGAAKASAPVAPEQGRLVVVAPAAGKVLIRRPGSRGFAALEGDAEIPVGSVVDARRGTVSLSSAISNGRVQTARFWGTQFAVGQSRGGDGMTQLTLAGGSFAACPRAGTASAAARRKPVRRLWGDDKGGRYRTRGRNSVATVRGTRWLTQDTCAGTLTRVVKGAVDVRDLRRGTVRRVRAGGSLLVRPGKR